MKVPNWKKNRRIAFFVRKPEPCKHCGRIGVHSLLECLEVRDCNVSPQIIPGMNMSSGLAEKVAAFAAAMCVVLLAACVSYQDMYQNKYTSVGGDADVTFPGGGHLTHSHTASFQHLVQGVVTVVGGIAAGEISKAKTASDNLAATTQQANTLNAQTQQAQIAATAAAATQKAANQAEHFQSAVGAGLFTPVPLPTPH